MLVIGLTGNIGCGKSSLSQIFTQQNIKIIDAASITAAAVTCFLFKIKISLKNFKKSVDKVFFL